MALQGGHRFAVSMEDAFPQGLYAMGVEQAMDYNAQTKQRTPTKDKQSGVLVWTVTCIDRDPEARTKEVKVKVTAPHCPTLPAEVVPNSGIRMVAFGGLTVTPYVEEGRGNNGRARLALSFRATDVIDPTTGVLMDGPSAGKPASRPASNPSGEGKAA